MTNVTIHGRFGEIVGNTHDLCCSTLSEVFRAIECNTGKIRSYIKGNKKRKISVFVDGKAVQEKNFDIVSVKNKKVVILPVLMGAVGFTIVAAVTTATKFTVGMTVAAVAINIAFSVGMSLLMSKLLAPDDPDIASTSSYVFGQAENVTKQGSVIPVGYGRFKVGSLVISTSLINADKSITSDESFYDNVFDENSPTQSQGSINISQSSISKKI